MFYKGKESRTKIGGSRIVDAIRTKGKKLFILTNNSTDTVGTIRSRLNECGIAIRKEEILTSGALTADYLRRKFGRVSYFLIGEAGLEAEMSRLGHRRTRGEQADAVVIGLDRHFTYEKLDHAARVVRNGSSIIATHRSRLYMYKTGPAVATGPIVSAVEYATGKRAVVIGKPSPLMFRLALERAKCRNEEAVMIGDQVETDLIGASRAGIDAILVTTGIDTRAKGVPTIGTFSNVDELVSLL